MTKRGKGKYKAHNGIRDIFKRYRQDFRKGEGYGYLPFRDVLIAFNKGLSKAIMEDSEVVRLPFRLGILYIQKKKQYYNKDSKYYNLNIDWVNTRKAGKRVFHLNEHTGGYYYKWMWYKRGAGVKNVRYYKFVPNRTNKRGITQLLKRGVDYYISVR